MPLDKDSIKATYSTDKDNILGNFYLPVLKNATRYDRAVGYFSTEALLWILQGLDGLIKNDGIMRLVVGSRLDDDEYDAIKNNKPSSLEAQEKIYNDFLNKWNELIKSVDMFELKKYRLGVFSWLAKTNKLEIKFALRKKGMFHKKIGVIKGDKFTVVFNGSLNETESAFEHNSENFDVFRSWREQAFEDHGEEHIKEFEDVWEGKETDTITLDVPSKCYDDIKNYWNLDRPPKSNLEKEAAKKIAEMFKKKEEEEEEENNIEYDFIKPKFPIEINGKPYKIQDHQRAALNKWRDKNYHGIMALATGTGKTITSIHGSTELAQNNKIVLVVAVPYIVLAEQWVETLRLFNINPIKCWSKNNWNSGLTREINNFNLDLIEFLCVVVVNASLKNESFQDNISKVSSDQIIFIGDECHHHDEKGLDEKLPEARYRLGLSATPWSESEVTKKESLESYYGEICETFSLQRAMKDDILTQYKYNIYPVSLNGEESEAYEEISKKISQMVAIKISGGSINESALQNLNFKRSRLLDSLENKFVKLEEIIKTKKPSPFTLFYSGSGSVESNDDPEDEDDFETVRSIDKITSILDKYGWSSSHFTSKQSPTKRVQILQNFKIESTEAIAAIKVLDEGFDVPMCREAYITASSRNERQFIQRRGRILRKADGKDEAIIHDFVILHNDSNPIYKSLAENEFKRVKEFYDSASNQEELLPQINKILKQFNIEEME